MKIGLIGLGIMGKKEGDTVTVEAPFGAMTFRVLNVSRQSQEGWPVGRQQETPGASA